MPRHGSHRLQDANIPHSAPLDLPLDHRLPGRFLPSRSKSNLVRFAIFGIVLPRFGSPTLEHTHRFTRTWLPLRRASPNRSFSKYLRSAPAQSRTRPSDYNNAAKPESPPSARNRSSHRAPATLCSPHTHAGNRSPRSPPARSHSPACSPATRAPSRLPAVALSSPSTSRESPPLLLYLKSPAPVGTHTAPECAASHSNNETNPRAHRSLPFRTRTAADVQSIPSAPRSA